MKVTAVLDGQNVTIVDVDVEAAKILITYILDSTQELFVVEKRRELPGNVPTLVGTGAVAV